MKNRIAVLVMTAFMVIMSVIPALAQGEIILTGGDLVVAGNPISFAGFVLDGETHLNVPGTTELWTAEDARGNGAGWRMTVSAADFTSGAYTIPATGFKVLLPQINIVTVAGNTAPVSQLTVATAIGTVQNLAVAAVVTGMGSYTLAPVFTLDVPASTFAGTYTSIVTVAVVAAP